MVWVCIGPDGFQDTPTSWPFGALRAAWRLRTERWDAVLHEEWHEMVATRSAPNDGNNRQAVCVRFRCLRPLQGQGSGVLYSKLYFCAGGCHQFVHMHFDRGLGAYVASSHRFEVFPP